MTNRDKQIERLLNRPKDMTIDEVSALLVGLGLRIYNKGATSGSRIAFIYDGGGKLLLHKPHPGKWLKPYQMTEIIAFLKNLELI